MKGYRLQRLLCFFFVAVLTLPLLCVPVGAIGYVSLDGSSVESDLEALIGRDELNELILDETLETDDGGQLVSVVRLLEFGYDARQTNWEYYGLYLYVYNPSGVALSSTTKNCVEMSVDLRDGDKTEVAKYPLKLLGRSSDNVLYKYEITGLRMNVLRRMDVAERTYRLSGLEIQFGGQKNATDFNVAMEITFTGFNSGFHADRTDRTDTLHWYYDQLETIELELHPTSWMSDTSDRGEGYKYEVSGVYFAIPNYYLKTYGNWDGDDDLKGLYAVSGSFYESRVNGLVTDNEEVFEKAVEAAGEPISLRGYATYRTDIPFSFCSGLSSLGASGSYIRNSFDMSYNIRIGTWNTGGLLPIIFSNSSDYILQKLCMAFQGSQDIIPANRVTAALNIFDSRLGTADTGRTYGYQTYKVTADDPPMGFTSYDYSQDHPFRAWFMKGGEKNDVQAEVNWLQRVDMDLLESAGAVEDFVIAEEYYIGEENVADLISFSNSKKAQTAATLGVKGSTVYVMHFAKTDYFATEIDAYDDVNQSVFIPSNSYYFERTVFEDFDILEFTFKRDNGKLTSIPVVASPVDISGGLPPADAPESNPSNPKIEDDSVSNWWNGIVDGFSNLKGWAKIIALLGGLVLLALILLLFRPVFTIFGKSIGAVFKGAGSVVRGGATAVSTVFAAREKSYDAKRKRVEDKQYDSDRERKQLHEDEDRKYTWFDRARRVNNEESDRATAAVERKRKQAYEDEDRKIKAEDRERKHAYQDIDRKLSYEDRKRRQRNEEIDRANAEAERQRRHKREDEQSERQRKLDEERQVKQKAAEKAFADQKAKNRNTPLKSPPPSKKVGDLGNSFDTDDFFQAALDRSWANNSNEDNENKKGK